MYIYTHRWISETNVERKKSDWKNIYTVLFHSYEFQKQGKLFCTDRHQNSAIDGYTQDEKWRSPLGPSFQLMGFELGYPTLSSRDWHHQIN